MYPPSCVASKNPICLVWRLSCFLLFHSPHFPQDADFSQDMTTRSAVEAKEELVSMKVWSQSGVQITFVLFLLGIAFAMCVMAQASLQLYIHTKQFGQAVQGVRLFGCLRARADCVLLAPIQSFPKLVWERCHAPEEQVVYVRHGRINSTYNWGWPVVICQGALCYEHLFCISEKRKKVKIKTVKIKAVCATISPLKLGSKQRYLRCFHLVYMVAILRFQRTMFGNFDFDIWRYFHVLFYEDNVDCVNFALICWEKHSNLLTNKPISLLQQTPPVSSI